VRVVLSGASGLIGSALKDALRADGHSLTSLVRRPPASAQERQWDPSRGDLDVAVLAEADAVVNLSGAGVGDHRWSEAYKRTLLDSRIGSTSTLTAGLSELGPHGPSTFISASAVGYYGDTGDRIVKETDPVGGGFLADLSRRWEDAAMAADRDGRRVVTLRTGLVLAPSGGLLGRLKPLVKLGLGGPLGSGRQFQPWISLDDEIGAIRFLLAGGGDAVAGPVNLTGPDPVRQVEFVRKLASLLHRPAIFPAPAFGLRLVLGQFADEGVLVGQRAVPAVLVKSGYQFVHPTLEGALRAALQPVAGRSEP
jgi:uncharacterized protein (TIGR01777 family)